MYIAPTGNIRLAFAGTYTPPVGNVRLAIGSEAGPSGPVIPPWQPPPPSPGGIRIGWGRYRHIDGHCALPWPRPARADREVALAKGRYQRADDTRRVPWNRLRRVDSAVAVVWQKSCHLFPVPCRLIWHGLHPADNMARLPWGEFAALDNTVRVPSMRLAPADLHLALAWGQYRQVTATVRFPYRPHLRWCDRDQVTRWGLKKYDIVCHRVYAAPEGNVRLALAGAYVPPTGNSRLFFDAMRYPLVCTQREPSGWRDNYTFRPTPIPTWPVAPKKPVYIMLNQCLVTRVSDGLPVDVQSVNITGDIDSWCWNLTATIPYEELAKVFVDGVIGQDSDLILIEISVNAWKWRFLVEKFSENHVFGQNTVTITGRSESALLAEPYAPTVTEVNSQLISANQAAAARLENLQWTIAWSIDDWLIAANCLALSNATPLAAIQKIAEAVAGRVQSARASRKLAVIQRIHGGVPWGWAAATPDIGLPEEMIRNLGRDLNSTPMANAIYISGQEAGILAKVRRQGTAGDVFAPMVTEALITATEAARMRGQYELGKLGAWKKETLALPLFCPGDLPGLLEIGALAEVAERGATWRGQVVAVRVSATFSGGKLIVGQDVDIERYCGR